MFYVIILHCLGKGGVLDAAQAGTVQYASAWFLETFAYCTVNIFGLISGYVGYSDIPKKTKYSNWILMWLQVVFYGIMITGVFRLIMPDAVTKKDFFEMFLPVSKELYWYFNCIYSIVLYHAASECSHPRLYGEAVEADAYCYTCGVCILR